MKHWLKFKAEKLHRKEVVLKRMFAIGIKTSEYKAVLTEEELVVTVKNGGSNNADKESVFKFKNKNRRASTVDHIA